jgi:signal transduction histidine kinase
MNSLRVRLLLMMAGVVVAAVGTAYLFADRGTDAAVNGLAAVTTDRDERLAASLMAELGPAPDAQLLQAEAEWLAQALEAQVLVADPQGQVLIDSSNHLVGLAIPLPRFPDERGAALVLHDELTYVVLRYPASSGVLAPARAEYAASAPVQAAQNSIDRSLLLAAAVGGGSALVLALVFSQRVVSPVEALTAAAMRLEKGDLRQRVSVRADDEIGTLARAFNAMADGLARTEQLRRQLVSDVAHELRTPLTNLRGYLEAVRDGVVEPRPEVVDSLYEETMHLIRLVDDLQDLALAEAGQLRLEPQPVSLGEAVSRALTALPPPLAALAAPIRVEVEAGLPPVYADPGRLRQVLGNLLTNAIAHTPRDGEIVVEARQSAGQVAVRVRDSGAGIAPEHLPFVFERFYRADPARARATGGAGLGLAIVKQLVEAQGGQVSAASAPGRGSTFMFTIPIAGPARSG